MKSVTAWLTIITISLVTVAAGRKHHKTHAATEFDYYLLSLSWAPTYCAGHPQDKSSECKTGNHTAFVLHGLWPSSNADPMKPLNCKPASPVSASIVQHMLEYFPSKYLVQHEWNKHGTCSGVSPAEYFAKVEQAYKAVQVPERYQKLSHSEQISVGDVEQDFSQANGAPTEAFRLSCHGGELVAVEVCLGKDLHYQACPKNARECTSQQVKLAPPK
jgi:ribonuclease T2